jgi:hypothetical protein
MPSHDKQNPSLIVAITLDIARHQEFINRFNQTLWLSLITRALLMSLLSWLAARRGLFQFAILYVSPKVSHPIVYMRNADAASREYAHSGDVFLSRHDNSLT